MADAVSNVVLKLKDQASKQLKDITKETDNLTSGLQRVTAAGNGMLSWGGKLTLGVTAPLLGAASAVISLANKVGNLGDDLLSAEASTGLTTDQIQAMGYAASQSGSSVEALASGAQNFTRRLKEGGEQSKDFQNVLKALGIQTTDSQGRLRSMSEMFPEVITKLQGIEDVTTRNSVAMQLFGGSAKELAPLLATSTSETASLVEEAQRLGLVLDRDALSAAEAFGDELSTLRAQAGAAVNKLALDLVPTARLLVEIFRNNVVPVLVSVGGFIGKLVTWWNGLDDTQKRVVLTILAVVAALPPLVTGIGAVITAVTTMTTVITALKVAMLALAANPVMLLISAVAGLVVALGINGLAKSVTQAGDAMTVLTGKLGSVRSAAADVNKAIADKNTSSMIAGLEKMRDSVDSDISTSITNLIQLLINAGDEAYRFFDLATEVTRLAGLQAEANRNSQRINELTFSVIPRLQLDKDSEAGRIRAQVLDPLLRQFGDVFGSAVSFDGNGFVVDWNLVQTIHENGGVDVTQDTREGIQGAVDSANRSLSLLRTQFQALDAAQAEASSLMDRNRTIIQQLNDGKDALGTAVSDGLRQYGGGGYNPPPAGDGNNPFAEQEQETANYVTRLVYEATHSAEDDNKALADAIKELEGQHTKLDGMLGEAIQAGNFDWASSIQTRIDSVDSGISSLKDLLPKPKDVKEIDQIADSLLVLTTQAVQSIDTAKTSLKSLTLAREGLEASYQDAVSRGDVEGIKRFSDIIKLYDDAVANVRGQIVKGGEGTPRSTELDTSYTKELSALIQQRIADGKDLDWFYEQWEGLAERYRNKAFEDLGTKDPVSISLQATLEHIRQHNKEAAETNKQVQTSADRARTLGEDRNRLFQQYVTEKRGLDDDLAKHLLTQEDYDRQTQALGNRYYQQARDSLGAQDELTLQFAQLIIPTDGAVARLMDAAKERARFVLSYQDRLQGLEASLKAGSLTQAQYEKSILDMTVEMFENAASTFGIDDGLTQMLFNRMNTEAPERAIATAVANREQVSKSLNEALAQVAASDAAGLYKLPSDKAEAIRQANLQAYLSAFGLLGDDDELTQSLLSQVLADNAQRERETLQRAQQQILEERQRNLDSLTEQLSNGLITPEQAREGSRNAYAASVVAAIGLGDKDFTSELMAEFREAFPEDEVTETLLTNLEASRASISTRLREGLLKADEADTELEQALSQFLVGYIQAHPEVDLNEDAIFQGVLGQLQDVRSHIRYKLLEGLARDSALTPNESKQAEAEDRLTALNEGLELAIANYGEASAQAELFRTAITNTKKALEDMKKAAALEEKLRPLNEFSKKFNDIAGTARELAVALFPDNEKVAAFFDTVINGFNAAVDVAGKLAAGDITGAISSAVSGIIGIVKGIISLFTPAWKKLAEDIKKTLTASISGAVSSALTNAIQSGDLTNLQQNIRQGIFQAVLGAIIDAFVQASLVKTILQPLIDQISNEVAKGNYDAALKLMDKALAETDEWLRDKADFLNKLNEKGKAFLDEAKDVNADTEDLAQWGQFMSQAISIPFYDATLRFDNSVNTFSGAVSRLVDEGITIQSAVTVNGDSTWVASY